MWRRGPAQAAELPELLSKEVERAQAADISASWPDRDVFRLARKQATSLAPSRRLAASLSGPHKAALFPCDRGRARACLSGHPKSRTQTCREWPPRNNRHILHTTAEPLPYRWSS